MCTALTLKTTNNKQLFGRNMDLEYNFNQSIIFLPRNYKVENKETNTVNINKYAILGMGTIINDYPTFSDVMNEKGLACAGLNFPNYAYYPKEGAKGKLNVHVYNLLLWIVSNYDSIKSLRKDITNLLIVDIPISKNVPSATLHFIVTDKSGETIVLEQTKDGLKIHENKVGVLTNSPTFDYHMMNLSNYTNLGYNHSNTINLVNEEIVPHGQGNSLLGIPGDVTPATRFVRSVVLKDATIKNSKNINIPQFFHILNGVSMVDGSVITKQGLNDITQYTSCMNLNDGIYYYNTYYNYTIMSIDMYKEDLNSKEMKIFKYNNEFTAKEEN